jgi:hypothetical protein
MMEERSTRTDRRIGQWLEDASRRLGRRKVLTNGLKGVAAAVAAVTVGTWPGRAVAHPGHPYCHYPGHGHCSNLGKSCPLNGGCPSGCYVCTTSSGCGGCIYSSGYWATSSHCGICGEGFKLCYDCRCTGCSRTCGCASKCLCSGCCRREDVEREMERAMAEAAALN